MSLADAQLFAMLEGGGRHLVANFSALSPAQRLSIPDVLARKPVLLVAPTAAGKTEAALAPLLTLLARERWEGTPSILYVTPTRALVNDLNRRLHQRLASYLVVGRRTGEYREPESQLLLTTPESLDSMLCRGQRSTGHALASVRAIVLDELHLLAESARGAQLEVLLARLDEVASTPVLRVAISATIPSPERLASRFLGRDAVVHRAGGGRSMRIDRATGDGPLGPRGDGVDPLAEQLWRVPESHGYRALAERLLAFRNAGRPLKALVFVPSRARCDRLAADLGVTLKGQAPIEVLAHHGSLDQARREAAEESLGTLEESIAVATSTLEVGIDVGDVSIVVLDGPPSTVSALLQRVGRGNRRSAEVFVLPLARNDVEACTLASMLRAAVAGDLDPEPETSHDSVALQQVASILFQAPRARRPRAAVERLLASTLGDRAARHLTQLEEGGWIRTPSPGEVAPTDRLREIMDSPFRLHANIGGNSNMVALVDAVTGDPIAWVPRGQELRRVVLAGDTWSADPREDRVELSRRTKSTEGASIRYTSRAAPLGRTALRHLAIGVGLSDRAIVPLAGEVVHFGGALFGRLLTLCGVDSDPVRSTADPRRALGQDVAAVVSRNWQSLEALCGFGSFQRQLPDAARRDAVMETVRRANLVSWLETREVAEVSQAQAAILEQA